MATAGRPYAACVHAPRPRVLLSEMYATLCRNQAARSLCSVCAQGDGVLSEFWNLVLLTTLYAMQGVPLGLTMGSM